jgi:hypothetical protein
VAIFNPRLVRLDDGRVTFTYKDYSQGGREREMTLRVEEFIRRFLLHVLSRELCPDPLLRPAFEPPSQAQFGAVP